MVERFRRRSAAAGNPVEHGNLQCAWTPGCSRRERVAHRPRTCTRCDECVRACADDARRRRRASSARARFRNFSVPTACYQCTDPGVHDRLPDGRHHPAARHAGGGDRRRDVHRLQELCPTAARGTTSRWSRRKTNAKRQAVATKCDLCIDRADGPACVQMCPHGAAVRVNFKEQDRVEKLRYSR